MRERDENIIVDFDARPASIELGVDISDRAEQMQRLIDQMRAEIVKQTARESRRALLAPAALQLRAPSLES
jgi:hypothetical protein